MSDYDNDPRVEPNADGTVTAAGEVVREDPLDDWCAYRGAQRTAAGFKTRDQLLERILGPALVTA